MKTKHFIFVIIMHLTVFTSSKCIYSQNNDSTICSNKGLSLTIHNYGLSFGNTKKNIGLRFNLSDSGVEEIIGLNVTLWRPGNNHNSSITGISFGLFPSCDKLNGISIGVVKTYAQDEIYGIHLGGAIGSGGDVYGLNMALTSLIADNEIKGVNVAGILNGRKSVYGVNTGIIMINSQEIGGISASIGRIHSENIIYGITFAGVIMTNELWGISASPFYIKTNILQGISIAGFHKITEQRGITLGIINFSENLHGIQIGLLNYAGNNVLPFKLLPILNFHN